MLLPVATGSHQSPPVRWIPDGFETWKGPEDRSVLEFDLEVRVDRLARDGGYWRVRGEERRQPRDTSVRDQSAPIEKAQDIVERLRRPVPTELGRAKGVRRSGQ